MALLQWQPDVNHISSQLRTVLIIYEAEVMFAGVLYSQDHRGIQTAYPSACDLKKGKVFYSSNKEITLDEVIFSSYIWKIESQLFWSGSSLGHKQRRGLRHLYCTSKRRFKGAVLTLSTWTLSVGTTSEVTDHILGAGKYCFGLFCDAP